MIHARDDGSAKFFAGPYLYLYLHQKVEFAIHARYDGSAKLKVSGDLITVHGLKAFPQRPLLQKSSVFGPNSSTIGSLLQYVQNYLISYFMCC